MLSSQLSEYVVALAKTLGLMVRLARSPGFDVVQACNPPDLFFLIVWPFKLAGKRFIFDQHDLSPELYRTRRSAGKGPVMTVLRVDGAHVRTASADAVDRVQRVLPAVARRGRRAGRQRVRRPQRPARGLAVRWNQTSASRRDARCSWSTRASWATRTASTCCWRRSASSRTSVGSGTPTFALVGDGNAGPALRRRAQDLGMDDYVDFVGWVYEDETISRYLLTADACVCPESSSPLNDKSTFIKVMEYMAAGRRWWRSTCPRRGCPPRRGGYAAAGDVEGFAAGSRRC